jgi:hypothetical protein
MSTFTNIPKHIEDVLMQSAGKTSRRNFLKTSGLLVVSFSAAPLLPEASAQAPASQGAGLYPDPDFKQLDSWIVIRENNTATFYVGKTDCGQGTGTAFRQMMADELDMAYEQTACVMGTTNLTVDQGGSGGSDAIQTDGWPMRRVAAEARRVLLDMASKQLGVPVDQLSVAAGVITVKADATKKVTYGELIGGKRFQRNADREQHRCDDRSSESQAGTGFQDHRQIASALRHPAESRCFFNLGGGRESSGHGACAQRQASTCGREADQHRRIVGQEHTWIH